MCVLTRILRTWNIFGAVPGSCTTVRTLEQTKSSWFLVHKAEGVHMSKQSSSREHCEPGLPCAKLPWQLSVASCELQADNISSTEIVYHPRCCKWCTAPTSSSMSECHYWWQFWSLTSTTRFLCYLCVILHMVVGAVYHEYKMSTDCTWDGLSTPVHHRKWDSRDSWFFRPGWSFQWCMFLPDQQESTTARLLSDASFYFVVSQYVYITQKEVSFVAGTQVHTPTHTHTHSVGSHQTAGEPGTSRGDVFFLGASEPLWILEVDISVLFHQWELLWVQSGGVSFSVLCPVQRFGIIVLPLTYLVQSLPWDCLLKVTSWAVEAGDVLCFLLLMLFSGFFLMFCSFKNPQANLRLVPWLFAHVSPVYGRKCERHHPPCCIVLVKKNPQKYNLSITQ